MMRLILLLKSMLLCSAPTNDFPLAIFSHYLLDCHLFTISKNLMVKKQAKKQTKNLMMITEGIKMSLGIPRAPNS